MCNCVSVSVSKQQRETNYAAAWPGVTQHSALLGNYILRLTQSQHSPLPPTSLLHVKNKMEHLETEIFFHVKTLINGYFALIFYDFLLATAITSSPHLAQHTARLSRALFTLLLRPGEARRRTCLGCPGSELVKPVTDLGYDHWPTVQELVFTKIHMMT